MVSIQRNRRTLLAAAGALALPTLPLASQAQTADAVPGFNAMSYIGVIAPAGVPQPLLNRISADIAQAVKSPAVTERMAQLGSESVGSTPEAYNAVIASEIDKWTKVVKDANIKVE